MWAGCYTLDLYCENFQNGGLLARDAGTLDAKTCDGVHGWFEFPHQYTGEYGAECRSRARKAGWIIKNDGTAICPRCSGKHK